MATQIGPQAAHLNAPSSSPGSPLTKDYIRKAYKHLEETNDLDVRNEFWIKYMVENVTWEITGNGHSLAGIRYSLAEHSAASFSKLGNQWVPLLVFFVRQFLADKSSRQETDKTHQVRGEEHYSGTGYQVGIHRDQRLCHPNGRYVVTPGASEQASLVLRHANSKK